VYFGARPPDSVERVDANGTLLPPFTTDVVNISYLGPGPAGGLLAVNGSGEICQFAANGTLLRFRDILQELPASGGIDLGSDQCTAFYLVHGAPVRWNLCDGSEPQLIAGPTGTSFAMRVLRDGSFLFAALGSAGRRVVHLAANGALIREYPVPGAHAVALDIDGTSFWTNSGNVLLRIDLASGAVLSSTPTPYEIYGLSVVGEPRGGESHAGGDVHPVPAATPLTLFALAATLCIAAAVRMSGRV
jgi:hypothetical protein